MIIEPIMKILQDANIGVIGTSIFGYYMPPDVNTGILVVSSLSGASISYETPNFRKDDRFQIITRAPSSTAALNLMRKVSIALTLTKDQTIPSLQTGIPDLCFIYIRPAHDPIVFPRLQSGLTECSLNLSATYSFRVYD